MDTVQQSLEALPIEGVMNSVQSGSNLSIWLWLAIIEFVAILALLLCIFRLKKQRLDLANISKADLRKNNHEVDMGSVVESIYKSKALYKELSKQYHPDLYVQSPLHSVAEELFQEMTKYRNNYKKLLELQDIAINKLNLK